MPYGHLIATISLFFVAYQNLPGIGVWYVNMVVT